ncbi:alpha/beta hydrolase [Ectothiorhodospiraceae bacterium WFHF3C12]|nr:alpha/beta hydrolase [Ectothiorhodospiraceae bacterium WFHF3C12]
MVFLHGWMDSGATFQFAVDHLPADWDIIAPDWRGFGGSDRAPESYYFPDYLADLDALLDRYFPEQPVLLVGHSMGGNVAGLYAGVRPERVQRLISLEGFGLASAAPEAAPERYAAWLDSLRETPGLRSFESYDALAAHLQRQNPRLTAERADYVARCWGESAVDGTVELRGDPRHKRPNPVLYRLEEAMACWRRVTAPTFWLLGAESDVLRRAGAESDFETRLACFAEIRTEVIEACGHSIHLDQPVRLAESIRVFTGD